MKSYINFSGLSYFLAGVIILMGIITGEVFYPQSYTTAQSEISDLGATRPPNSVSFEPSATIFNLTMIVSGLLLLVGAFLLTKVLKHKIWSLPMWLMGVGVTGVGVFPGNYGSIHPIFALTSFVAGGISAIVSAKIVKKPFGIVTVGMGIITLASLFGAEALIPIFGDGGTERWVAYPVVLWMCGFGGFLMGKNNKELI